MYAPETELSFHAEMIYAQKPRLRIHTYTYTQCAHKRVPLMSSIDVDRTRMRSHAILICTKEKFFHLRIKSSAMMEEDHCCGLSTDSESRVCGYSSIQSSNLGLEFEEAAVCCRSDVEKYLQLESGVSVQLLDLILLLQSIESTANHMVVGRVYNVVSKVWQLHL